MRFAPLLVGPAVALTAALALAPPGPAAPVSPHAVVAPSGYRARRSLPDSVLLRISGTEDVTRRRFVRAVRLLGGNPDSLTPATRDQFLELVKEQRVLSARAIQAGGAWEHSDSMQFLGERDNILIRAALSDQFTRVEARRRAAGEPDLDDQALGMAARETLMRELKPVYDEELLKRVGSYFAELPQPTPDMSPRKQLEVVAINPKVPAGDTLKVLARSALGEFTVAELLADWRRLSSVYRPHVGDAEALRAVVQNSLFERFIRRAADDPALLSRPEVAAVIADRAEYHAVSHYLQREVVAKVPTDSLTLLAHYRANLHRFDRPARAVMVLLSLEDSTRADSLARRFRVPGEAESLAFRAQRGGVNYTHVATLASDSALYREAVRTGVGGVNGPVRGDAAWRVFRVLSLDPAVTQPFADVRESVLRSWYDVETERRIRALLEQLKRAARFERNEPALRALVLPAARKRP